MLEEYLSRSEGKTLEFKENTRGLQAIVKTVVAFANSSGGDNHYWASEQEMAHVVDTSTLAMDIFISRASCAANYIHTWTHTNDSERMLNEITRLANRFYHL